MTVGKTNVKDFLSTPKTQFVIPVYQRNYDWSTSQCKQLLDDILEVGKSDTMNAHFIGSVVYVHDGDHTSSSTNKLTVIDGQQRLTTLTLIYLALYRLAIKINKKDRADKINDPILIGKYVHEKEKLKLRLTEHNDKAINHIFKNDKDEEEFSDFSKIIENFEYFESRITEENFKYILDGLSKLMFVEISLDREEDNPQRIFESLNSTGLELSQADLIRNYILMGLGSESQNKIYNNYWKTIEKLAKDETLNISKVSDFIRDYLTLVNNKIPNKSKVYVEFKKKFTTTVLQELETNLSPIKSLAKFYNKLLNPKKESDKEIRLQLECINRLEVNVAYPFLMKVYEDFDKKVIDKAIFIEILDFIQAFVWRRFIVGLPTNALNKIFMTLYEKVDKKEYLLSLQKRVLKRPGPQRFPKDKEVVESLKLKDVYNIKPKSRTYLFERLENFENKEPVIIEGNTDITIEHIFPQNPDPKWKVDLGADEYNLIKETYLNTIGNLTLSGNNVKLGNKPFVFKRDKENAGYKDSRLWLNRYLSKAEEWGEEEIKKRLDLLTKRFLKIWKLPDIQLEEKGENNEVNIFEAEEPKYKKLQYAIFFDEKTELTQVSKLYTEIMKQLFELQPERFFTTDLAEQIKLTKNPIDDALRTALRINDTYFIEGNMENNQKFEKIKKALTIFNLEDELFIKYAENE